MRVYGPITRGGSLDEVERIRLELRADDPIDRPGGFRHNPQAHTPKAAHGDPVHEELARLCGRLNSGRQRVRHREAAGVVGLGGGSSITRPGGRLAEPYDG